MSANKILFERGIQGSSDAEHYEGTEGNNWDDSSLNSAYDKAMKIAKAEVAKRVAMSTNSQTGQKPTKKASKGKRTLPSSSKAEKEWKAGMACRAVFQEDGLEYEAFVLRIVDDQQCIVRFLGYDNCDIVPIDGLLPSLGKNECQKQIQRASLEKTDGYPDLEFNEADTIKNYSQKEKDQTFLKDGQPDLQWKECESERVASPGSTEFSFQRSQKSPKKKSKKAANFSDVPEMPFSMPNIHMRSMMPNLGSLDMPLPPPPISIPHERPDPEDQAVSSMLMSWYMSGYYTGLYQGLKRAKQGRKRV